jgi:hypothetical protein
MRAVHRVCAPLGEGIGDGAVFGEQQELTSRDSRKRKTNVVLIRFVLALLGWLFVHRTRQAAAPHLQLIVAH